MAPLEEDKFDLGGAKVVLEGDASNALFLTDTDLAAPENTSTTGPGSTQASNVATCGEALRGQFIGAAKGAEYFLSTCARAEYAFVLRTLAYDHAQVLDDENFAPGRYEGDVLLFRLADGALLGGFHVAATNGSQVSVEVGAAGAPVDAASRLDSDLEAMVFVEINDKLKQHVPGVLPEAPAG
jgi:hypothetical protein